MDETPKRFTHRPLVVVLLAVAHLFFGAVCLFMLMAHGLMVGFWEGVGLGFGMIAVGATTTGVLTHFNPRMRWLWIVTFCILPFVYIIPSYFLYARTGNTLPLTYWITYPITLVCACLVGSEMGARFELWNRMRQPTRGKFVRRLIRWLS